MFCKNCGMELPDGVKFCTGCGAELSPSPMSDAPAPASKLRMSNSFSGSAAPKAAAAPSNPTPDYAAPTAYGTPAGDSWQPNAAAAPSNPASGYAAPPYGYSTAPVQPGYPPMAAQPVYAQKKSKKWLIPVIIGAVVAVAAAVVFLTAKKCDNCGKLFWSGGHEFTWDKTYYICDDCWNEAFR